MMSLQEVMMRKKSALHLDSRYTTMIENAYYYSNPPEARQEAKVKRPPMHEYIRKLLYKDLAKTTIERVLRQMRKLDWDSIEVPQLNVIQTSAMLRYIYLLTGVLYFVLYSAYVPSVLYMCAYYFIVCES